MLVNFDEPRSRFVCVQAVAAKNVRSSEGVPLLVPGSPTVGMPQGGDGIVVVAATIIRGMALKPSLFQNWDGNLCSLPSHFSAESLR
jgi:hypothetical protein